MKASRLRRRSHCPAKLVARLNERRSASIRARLLLELVRPAQPAANRDVQQLIVRDAAPQEEGEPRCQLEIGDAVYVSFARPARRSFSEGGVRFDAEQKLRVDQHRAQRSSDSRVEISVGPPLSVKRHRPFDFGFRNGPPICAPHQRRQNGFRALTLFFRVRCSWPAHENPAPARRVFRAVGSVGSAHGDLVEGRTRARMTALVEAGQLRLPCGFQKGRGVLDESDANLVRTCAHGHSHLQIFVQRRIVAGGLQDGEGFHRLAVDENNQLVWAGVPQSTNVAVQVARKPHLDFVLAVLDERVRDRHAAACAEREARNMSLLRPIGRQPERVGLQRRLRAADCKAADFLGGGDVAVEQHRRQITDRDVVEAVAAFIRRQKRRGIDVHRQEISDGVSVFGAIQTTQRLGAAGVWIYCCRLIERCFQRCEKRSPIVRGELRHVGRRHRAGVHLAHHLFPDFRIGAGVGDVGPVQHQTRGLHPFVVARDAVLVEKLAMVRWGLGGRRGPRAGLLCRRLRLKAKEQGQRLIRQTLRRAFDRTRTACSSPSETTTKLQCYICLY